jgi:hypothetical protein
MVVVKKIKPEYHFKVLKKYSDCDYEGEFNLIALERRWVLGLLKKHQGKEMAALASISMNCMDAKKFMLCIYKHDIKNHEWEN